MPNSNPGMQPNKPKKANPKLAAGRPPISNHLYAVPGGGSSMPKTKPDEPRPIAPPSAPPTHAQMTSLQPATRNSAIVPTTPPGKNITGSASRPYHLNKAKMKA